MLQTQFKDQQIEYEKVKNLHIPEFSISISLSSYEQKCPCQNTEATASYCPDGVVVKLYDFQAI